jgi:glycosyltransferase involved in cell wall biosynthesis
MGWDWSGMDLTLLVCNYNTPDLVLNMLRSVEKTCSNKPKVVVMNTSTENSTILDDNKIPYFNYRGGIHGEAVNLGLRKVKTRYVLLVDSDIILLQDYSVAFERFKSSQLAIMGRVVGDCAGKQLYPRVEPWFCFIDLDKLKAHKIEFFDGKRARKSKSEPRVYDVGSTMFEDITNAGLMIGDVNLENRYFKHYGGMSWREQKYNPNDVDTDIDFGGTHPNKALYNYGKSIRQSYLKETEYLNSIDVIGKFK